MHRLTLLFWLLLAAPGQAQDMPIIAAMAPENSPARHLYDALLKNLDDFSGGRLKVETFLSGELGPEDVYFNAARRGRIQMTAVSAYALGRAVPEYALLRAPYLFDSYEEFSFIYDTYLKPVYADLLAEQGLVELRWVGNGFENVYGDRPLTHPDLVKGVRIRVPVDPNSALVFEAVEADVIQVPFTEVIQSLQTGLINGGESTTLFYLTGQFQTEAKHLTRTRHGFSTGALVANKRWFDAQPEEDQDIYRRIYIAPDEAYWSMDAITKAMLADAVDKGTIVHDLSDEDRKAWKAATSDVIDIIKARVGGESERILALIEEGKAVFAAAQ